METINFKTRKESIDFDPNMPFKVYDNGVITINTKIVVIGGRNYVVSKSTYHLIKFHNIFIKFPN